MSRLSRRQSARGFNKRVGAINKLIEEEKDEESIKILQEFAANPEKMELLKKFWNYK